MDLRKLKKLIDLVQESGISELEVTEGEEKVRIAKHATGPAPVSSAPQAPVMHAAPAAAAPAVLLNTALAANPPTVGTLDWLCTSAAGTGAGTQTATGNFTAPATVGTLPARFAPAQCR